MIDSSNVLLGGGADNAMGCEITKPVWILADHFLRPKALFLVDAIIRSFVLHIDYVVLRPPRGHIRMSAAFSKLITESAGFHAKVVVSGP